MPIVSNKLRSIEAIADENIDFSDIPEADDRFWRRAELQIPQPIKRAHVRSAPSRTNEVYAAPRIANKEVTSRAAASAAGKVLRNLKASRAAKSAAASSVTQRPNKKQ